MLVDRNDQFRSSHFVVGLNETFLFVIIVLSFFFHFFVSVFSGLVFLVIYTLAIVLFVICKPMVISKDYLAISWLISASVIIGSYMNSNRYASIFVDMATLIFGVLLVIFPDRRYNTYRRVTQWLIIFSVIFAVGVYLQVFFPSINNVVLSILPSKYTVYRLSANPGNSGFSTNSGFTAGYIVSGILAAFSYVNSTKNIRKRLFLLFFLLFALLLTNKRGHVIFLSCTIILCYIIPAKGKEKYKKYFGMVFAGIVMILLFYVFSDYILLIPGLNRIVQSFSGDNLEGTDITSGRIKLYARAWQLFIENPFFGIGWGEFKETTTGSFRIFTILDTHNIYLQVLCESGVIGGLTLFLSMAVFWVKTKKAYIESQYNNFILSKWKHLLYFSFSYQTFFLLYGLTGNVLYDQHYIILYMVSCSIIMAYRKVGYQNRIVTGVTR